MLFVDPNPGPQHGNIINLVVCRLNVYVGKERMLVFPFVISVTMTQKAVATVVRGNRDPNQQFSPCLQPHKLCNFKLYDVHRGYFNKYLP